MQNQFVDLPAVVIVETMIERSLSKPIREALGVFPVVYVADPRQAGKSTFNGT